MTLEAPSRARSGERVPLVFTVTNAGKVAVTMQLLGRTPTADFLVSDASDRLVWSLLRGQTMLGALRLVPLAAGERLTFRHTWNQHIDAGGLVPPGRYLIQGVLLTDEPGGLASPPSRLSIERGP